MDTPQNDDVPVGEQLQRAVRDLWSMMVDSGDNYVVFMDRRRMNTRVEQAPDHRFHVSWQTADGDWVPYDGAFSDPREAAFHAYQGPH